MVVGISRYPGLRADGVVADLEGPDADAQAVHDWLVDGGGLDPDRVRLVRSAQFDATEQEPASAHVEQQLREVEEQTRGRPGGRLYLYFAGHGFSPVLEEGALFTADASSMSPAYVYAHAWLRWFRTAQRFRESVLWMDACMTTQQSIPVRDVLLRPEHGTGVPGPAFVALAAQTKSAVELPMPDGQVHGVFTWALLQGLRGGAADDRGQVTGRSLRAFLHNALPELLPASAHRATAVDLQPFVRADEGMVFRRLSERPTHETRLTLPTARAGQTLTLWAGRPPVPVVSAVLEDGSWSGRLVRGLYVADLPEAGLRQGFQVSGAGPVQAVVEHEGPPVRTCDRSALFALRVRVANAAASVAVVGADFERTFTATGGLDEREAPGVYKLRVQHGRNATTVAEQVVLLDRDLELDVDDALAVVAPAPARAASAAPSRSAPPAPPDPRGAAQQATQDGAGAHATVWLALEAAEAGPDEEVGPPPRAGLELRDAAGRLVGRPFDEGVGGSARTSPTWSASVPPGVGSLRLTLRRRTYEGPVVALPGWTTQVVLRQRAARVPGLPDSGDVGTLAEVAVLLRSADSPPGPREDAVLETARQALGDGRDLLGHDHDGRLQELLLGAGADPVARIVGAHLVLRAAGGDLTASPVRAAAFDAAVADVRTQVGHRLPDVEALSLRCLDPALRTARPISDPPLFAASWQLMAEASYAWPELVPRELWHRIHAWTRFGTWFVWAVDDAARAAHDAQLAAWMASCCEAGDASAAEQAGRRLLAPAAAVAELWDAVCR